MKKVICILLSVILLSSVAGCKDIGNTKPVGGDAETTTKVTTTTQPPVQKDSIVHTVCAGDNLIHSSIYNQAQQRAGGKGYNFDFAYQNISKLVNGCDLGILNQESPVCNDVFEPSSYPSFNSPTQLGDKMISMGFNAFSHSNNHILDKGEKGLIATLDYWKSRNMLAYGAYRNQEDVDTVKTKTINGIKFSFVGFTEHTNGIKLSANAEAKIIYTSDTEKMKDMIEKAKAVSDCVVVSVHWGNENSNIIADRQKTLAKQFADWGANLIIGTHPHVVQSMEYIDKPDGSKAFVAYSLGNFISAQSVPNNLIGIVLDCDIVKSGKTGQISIENVKAKPVITHYDYGFKNLTAYTYPQYNDTLAQKHGVNKYEKMSMQKIDYILEKYIPQEYLYLK